MTDESTSEDENITNNYHRNSTVRHTLQTSKRIIDYALSNSPETDKKIENMTISPYSKINIKPKLKLQKSDTTPAVLDDIADFINDSDDDNNN